MISKDKDKQSAIILRKSGLTYSEILKKVPVAKSTLSIWLRDVGLSSKQKQRISERKIEASLKGAKTRHNQRILVTKEIQEKAQKEIDGISEKELRLIGAALYWAEGSKEKAYRPGAEVKFSNSDPLMIKLFLKWLKDICAIDENRIIFEIYIHENFKNDINKVIDYWQKNTGFPKCRFDRIYFKRNKILTKRKNVGNFYYGLLRVKVKASSDLNRKITGWILGICKQCRVV